MGADNDLYLELDGSYIQTCKCLPCCIHRSRGVSVCKLYVNLKKKK